jgi:hypothetical protein
MYAQFLGLQGQVPTLRIGDQLVVNYFESNPEKYETHLVITDVEGAGPVVNVLVYDASGDLLDQQYYFLPIFGKVNYNPADRIGNKVFRGTIRIISDGGNIAAQYWQFYRDPGKMAFNTAIPASDGSGTTALLAQHFVASPNIDAKIVLVNPASDSTITVAVTFYLDTGKQLTRDKHRIPPNGSIVLDPYIENEGLIKTGVAYCEVLSGGLMTGEYWQASADEQYQISLPMEIIPKRDRNW